MLSNSDMVLNISVTGTLGISSVADIISNLGMAGVSGIVMGLRFFLPIQYTLCFLFTIVPSVSRLTYIQNIQAGPSPSTRRDSDRDSTLHVVESSKFHIDDGLYDFYEEDVRRGWQ